MSTDRRKQTLGSIVYGALNPRRSYNRRNEDDQVFIIDIYDTGLFFLAVSIILMSVMDAFFTLKIIAMGGEELNLFMKVLLETDIYSFLMVKYWATAFGVILLIAMSRMHFMGVLRVRRILQGVFMMYASLMIYEVYLLVVQISTDLI